MQKLIDMIISVSVLIYFQTAFMITRQSPLTLDNEGSYSCVNMGTSKCVFHQNDRLQHFLLGADRENYQFIKQSNKKNILFEIERERWLREKLK